MEQIRDSVSKSLPPLVIYLDELRELASFLDETCGTLVIETCGYRLNSIDEVSELPLRIGHVLEIKGTDPYLTVRLTRFGGDIYVSGGDTQSEGVAAAIERILLTGKVRLPLLPLWASMLSGMPLVIAAPSKHMPTIVLAGIVTFILFVWTMYGGYLTVRRHNTLVFKPKKDCPGFWERNKDKIILLVIGAVLGSLLTLLINTLVKP